jgi:hypothetical protein
MFRNVFIYTSATISCRHPHDIIFKSLMNKPIIYIMNDINVHYFLSITHINYQTILFNSIQFNSIQIFIISVLHQQPEGQLQMQHKGKQNNKHNKITTTRLQ